jgi:hypothetical protein
MDVIEQLNKYMDNDRLVARVQPKWLYSETINVYVRKATRRIPLVEGNKIYFQGPCRIGFTLDIASIEVPEHLWNRGICQQFIIAAHELNPWDGTYIENLMSNKMIHIARKLGFKVCNLDGLTPCFMKLTRTSDNGQD